YFIRYPAMQVRGLATTPSDVEIYVNGALVDRRRVEPGQFELRNLPVSSGTGMTRIVVRDVYGNEQVQTNSYYYSTAVLAPGMNEYSYSTGFLRGSTFADPEISRDYGDLAFAGTHRRGINNYLTLGGRAEITAAVRSAGPSAALRTRMGDFELAAGASDADGRRGSAGLFGYNFLTRRFSLGLSVRAQSREYAHLALTPEAERPLLDVNLFGSVIVLRRTSLTAQISSLNMRDGADTKRVAVGTNLSFGRYANVFVSVGGSHSNQNFEPEYILGLSLNAGTNVSASISAARRNGENQVTTELQRPLPIGTGYGFRIGSTVTDEEPSVPAIAQYQTDFGRYEIGFDPVNSSDPTISASGGLVLGGGALMFTRAVQDSYAIVRVPGVEGVRVYASNQVIGRTNRRGNLLVPNLLSYYGNQIRINDQDVPLDYNVFATEKVIAPPYRGGAIVQFPVAVVRSVEGSVIVRSSKGEQVPTFGQLTLSRNGKQEISPLGTAGEFYMENLEPGSWDALVEWEDGTCRFALVVPAGSEPSVPLGSLTCNLEEPRK
ncbi:MAG: fimbrial biogenesis outer membrane usher protein, partial [Thermoanaerobaculia bacterium]|nr:fimbrial biogenesis outer membrane usher protein [Thermoanaerobaculia bacterium]